MPRVHGGVVPILRVAACMAAGQVASHLGQGVHVAAKELLPIVWLQWCGGGDGGMVGCCSALTIRTWLQLLLHIWLGMVL